MSDKSQIEIVVKTKRSEKRPRAYFGVTMIRECSRFRQSVSETT
jgi:hypothetical protein